MLHLFLAFTSINDTLAVRQHRALLRPETAEVARSLAGDRLKVPLLRVVGGTRTHDRSVLEPETTGENSPPPEVANKRSRGSSGGGFRCPDQMTLTASRKRAARSVSPATVTSLSRQDDRCVPQSGKVTAGAVTCAAAAPFDGARAPAWSIHQVPPPGPVRVSTRRPSSPATGACATWLLSTAIIQVRTARILAASVGGAGRPSAGAMSWRRCVWWSKTSAPPIIRPMG